MNTFETKIVRSNGAIDINSTLTAVHSQLTALAARERADFDLIGDSVEKVWTEHPGMKSFQLGVLAAYTMNHLQVPPTEFEEIQERVKDYLRNETDKYAIVRGKGGGVANLSRLSSEERAKVEAQRNAEQTKRAAKQSAAVNS